LPEIILRGKVFSGTGKGKCFVDLLWVRHQLENALDFSPYSGTLNIRLKGKDIENKLILENSEGTIVVPQVGYYPGMLFEAKICSLQCAVVIPLVPNYPKDLLEVIAPVYLRGILNLVDGNEVTITVKV
jgi:riboflavin kinase